MDDLSKALSRIKGFRADSLSSAVANVETKFVGSKKETAATILETNQIGLDLLLAAILIKKHSNQINEIVHAIGILLALPVILREGEIVESLSLAAGNTGKGFDLETNKRIAEFTFIQWQGGPEVIRQNKILKDFFFLAEAITHKQREMYLLGTSIPQKFFSSNRALEPILKGNAKLGNAFREKYGNQFSKVAEYCLPRLEFVALRDICDILPVFKGAREAVEEENV